MKPAAPTIPISRIKVSDIVVAPNRMRALRPEKIAEITESIQAQGLLQPIVVRPRGRGSFWLVASGPVGAALDAITEQSSQPKECKP
jgi:hypothetical protein